MIEQSSSGIRLWAFAAIAAEPTKSRDRRFDVRSPFFARLADRAILLRSHDLIRYQILRIGLFPSINDVFWKHQSSLRRTTHHAMMSRRCMRHLHRGKLQERFAQSHSTKKQMPGTNKQTINKLFQITMSCNDTKLITKTNSNNDFL